MIKFKEWLKLREMLSPVPFPSVTNRSPETAYKLNILTAFPTGEAKVPKKKILKKGSEDGDWR